MAQADTSFYRATPAQPLNPLDLLGRYAQTQNALNQAQIFQMQLRARKAMQGIFQQSLTPDGKSIDWNKAILGAATNPDTAWMVSDLVNSLTQRRLVDAQTAAKLLEVGRSKFQAIAQGVESLLPLGEKVTKADVVRVLGGLVQQGIITPQDVTNTLATMPEGGAPLQEVVRREGLLAMNAHDAAAAASGSIVQSNTGGVTHFIRTVPLTQTVQDLGSLPNTLTPAERNTPTSYKSNTGEQKTGTRQDVLPVVTGTGETEPGSGKLSAATGGTVTTQISPTAESVVSKYIPNLQRMVQTGIPLLQNNERMLALMQRFKSGLWFSDRLGTARLLNQIGIAPETAARLIGNPNAALEYMKLQVQSSAQQYVQSIDTSHISEAGREEFQKVIQNPNTDPAALEAITQRMIALVGQNMQELNEYEKFTHPHMEGGKMVPGRDPAEWPNIWPQLLTHAGQLQMPSPEEMQKYLDPNAPIAAPGEKPPAKAPAQATPPAATPTAPPTTPTLPAAPGTSPAPPPVQQTPLPSPLTPAPQSVPPPLIIPSLLHGASGQPPAPSGLPLAPAGAAPPVAPAGLPLPVPPIPPQSIPGGLGNPMLQFLGPKGGY